MTVIAGRVISVCLTLRTCEQAATAAVRMGTRSSSNTALHAAAETQTKPRSVLEVGSAVRQITMATGGATTATTTVPARGTVSAHLSPVSA